MTDSGMESRTADGCFLGDVGACGAPRSWGVGAGGLATDRGPPEPALRDCRGASDDTGFVIDDAPSQCVFWERFDGPCLEGRVLKAAGSGDPMLSDVISVTHPLSVHPSASQDWSSS